MTNFDKSISTDEWNRLPLSDNPFANLRVVNDHVVLVDPPIKVVSLVVPKTHDASKAILAIHENTIWERGAELAQRVDWELEVLEGDDV